VRIGEQGVRLPRLHPDHQAAPSTGRNRHVAADQEGEPAEHAHLADAGLVGLEELAALERDCCEFAAWTIRTEGAELVLHVSAKDGAVAAVHALCEDLLAPAGPGAGR